MKRLLFIVLGMIVLVPIVLLGIEFLHDPGSDEASVPVANPSEQIARGAYLARAGNCMACHTVRGGSPNAGGRAIATPFGNIFSTNITPDPQTGIGRWSSYDFWRALHNGKSKDGSFLYPAFPYPNFTKVTRADSDAIFAYFNTLPPVYRCNQEHELRFPYNQRWLLAGWRALYFRPGVYQPDTGQTLEWNRGAYLVQGLGHCGACHTSRNALGATEQRTDLAGGVIPMLNWYAPSLTSSEETGIGDWDRQHIADLLKTGVSTRGAAFGPMAEVVRESLQYLSDSDVDAMAGYLKSLPQTGSSQSPQPMQFSAQESENILKQGAELYRNLCIECHRANGEGIPPAYPPLAGNRSLTAYPAINSIRMVLNGGYPPSTAGNPRPYGMPPFGPTLNDTEVAAVVSYIRNAWGNQGSLVSPIEVAHNRGIPLD
jgi:mono/diheme cytochrome c family protein